MKVRTSSVVAAIAILALDRGATAHGPQRGELAELRAQPPTWILDHRSGAGMRVRDALAAERSAAQFASTQPAGYSPAQIRRAYGFNELEADGAGQVIGIVNAFHYPKAGADLAKFIKTFGLPPMFGLPGRQPCTAAAGPHPCFEVVFARGVKPAFDPGWAVESALDVQWAHAIAPGADILLVEASSDFLADMFQAVLVSTNLGATVVSMSWGATETAAMHIFEPLLVVPGVSFFAAAGDMGTEINYPAASPNVIAVGGTRLTLNKNGKRKGAETAWTGSGGGISSFTAVPSYQSGQSIPATGGFRGVPDVSYNADPDTGYAFYLSHKIDGASGWFTVGGTSAGSPQWAALVALVNELRGGDNLSGHDLLRSPIYDAAADQYGARFFDIKSGSNGPCGAVCTAAKGYDFVTGLGSPKADALVEGLAED